MLVGILLLDLASASDAQMEPFLLLLEQRNVCHVRVVTSQQGTTLSACHAMQDSFL